MPELLGQVLVLEVGRETASRYAALAEQYAMPVVSQDRHFDAVPGLRRVGW